MAEEKSDSERNGIAPPRHLNYLISNCFFNHWLDCETGQAGDAECESEPKLSATYKKESKSLEANDESDLSDKKSISEPDFPKAAGQFEQMHFLGGLLLGFASIISGIFLFINGVTGDSSWTAKIWRYPRAINDTGLGVVLFILGLFMVFITRFAIKKRQ